MKVLHFYKTYLPDTIGGVAQVINQLAKGTKKLGVHHEILSLSPSKNKKTITIDGHLVHQSHTNFEIASTPFSFSAFSQFKKLAKQADIIHYHFPYPFADILHLFVRINKPCLVSYHSDIIKQKYLLKLYRPLMRHFLSSVDNIVAASPNYLKTSDVLSQYKNKTSVIPYGLDKNSYPIPKAKKLKYWKDKFPSRFFLFIGVLRYYKGLHILLDVACNCEYPIVIVGAGLKEAELKKQAHRLGIKNIHFVGFLPDEDKVALLQLCYSLIFPSHLRSEAFGISLLEGAMYGKPLISCEIGTGTSFVNIDKETGIVVPPSDPAALRKAMDYLWDNPKEAAIMGRRSEKRYEILFTAEKMSQSYFELYKKLYALQKN